MRPARWSPRDGPVLRAEAFCVPGPKLTYTVSGDTITVRASAYARCVEIDCADTDMVLSDNYFEVNAGGP